MCLKLISEPYYISGERRGAKNTLEVIYHRVQFCALFLLRKAPISCITCDKICNSGCMRCGQCGEEYKEKPLVAEASKDGHDSNLSPPAKKRRKLLYDGSSGSESDVGKCYCYITT